jgi:hypothetical protein
MPAMNGKPASEQPIARLVRFGSSRRQPPRQNRDDARRASAEPDLAARGRPRAAHRRETLETKFVAGGRDRGPEQRGPRLSDSSASVPSTPRSGAAAHQVEAPHAAEMPASIAATRARPPCKTAYSPITKSFPALRLRARSDTTAVAVEREPASAHGGGRSTIRAPSPGVTTEHGSRPARDHRGLHRLGVIRLASLHLGPASMKVRFYASGAKLQTRRMAPSVAGSQ